MYLAIGLPPRLRRESETLARLRDLWRRFGSALLTEAQRDAAPWALATFGDPTRVKRLKARDPGSGRSAEPSRPGAAATRCAE